MKKLMTIAFVAGLTLTSVFASAAALCPPSSCNPYNGCMDGCSTYTATGVAVCNDQDPKAAEKEAIGAGASFASRSCYSGFFMTSPWQVNTVSDAAKCEVRANATFSCLQ